MTTTPTTTTTPPADGQPAGDPTTEPGGDGQDLAAELEKWKSMARKLEVRAKSNAKAAEELEQLRSQSMTDQEKAVREAFDQGRAEARREAAGELVAAEIRVSAAGRQVDADALLEGLDPTRFLTDDGKPNGEAIKAWMEKVAPAARQPDPIVDLGQGPRGHHLPLNGDPLEQALKNAVGIR